MVNLDISHFEGFLIIVPLKNMILCKFSKNNLSPNGLYAEK